MKVAVIGRGKTGQAVIDALPDHEIHAIYSSQNPVTVSGLQGADIAIVFVDGAVLNQIIDVLLVSGIPVICGTTGYAWPDNWGERLCQAKRTWIWGSNFSLGIQVIRRCIHVLSQAKQMMPDAAYSIHEVHHTQKKDAPSGTAFSMQGWLNQPCEITADREGDVKGYHELTLKTASEEITLSHNALNRQVFAEGALWAARYLVTQQDQLSPGMYEFSDIIDQVFKEAV